MRTKLCIAIKQSSSVQEFAQEQNKFGHALVFNLRRDIKTEIPWGGEIQNCAKQGVSNDYVFHTQSESLLLTEEVQVINIF